MCHGEGVTDGQHRLRCSILIWSRDSAGGANANSCRVHVEGEFYTYLLKGGRQQQRGWQLETGLTPGSGAFLTWGSWGVSGGTFGLRGLKPREDFQCDYRVVAAHNDRAILCFI